MGTQLDWLTYYSQMRQHGGSNYYQQQKMLRQTSGPSIALLPLSMCTIRHYSHGSTHTGKIKHSGRRPFQK